MQPIFATTDADDKVIGAQAAEQQEAHLHGARGTVAVWQHRRNPQHPQGNVGHF